MEVFNRPRLRRNKKQMKRGEVVISEHEGWLLCATPTVKPDLRMKPHPNAMDFFKALEVAGKAVRDIGCTVTIYKYFGRNRGSTQRNFWLVVTGTPRIKTQGEELHPDWRPMIEMKSLAR